MKYLLKIKEFYVGLDTKDVLVALLVSLIVICAQLAKINSSVLDVAGYMSGIRSEIRYK